MPITVEILKEIKNNNIFLETGSFLGDGIEKALKAGFKKVYSIECNEKYFNYCKDKFVNNETVVLLKGDSAKEIAEIIKTIDEPITFWLDAHYMFNDESQKIEEHSQNAKIPLIDELNQIKNHHIKNHTLLIDDLTSLANLEPRGDKPPTGSIETQTEKLIEYVKNINNEYTCEVKQVEDQDKILICKIKK